LGVSTTPNYITRTGAPSPNASLVSHVEKGPS
jgi:hypothetical protein